MHITVYTYSFCKFYMFLEELEPFKPLGGGGGEGREGSAQDHNHWKAPHPEPYTMQYQGCMPWSSQLCSLSSHYKNKKF